MLDGTSGNYESDFRGSGRGVGKIAGEAHDFDPGPARAALRPAVRGQRRRRRDVLLGRAAGPARRRTTTSTCSTAQARSSRSRRASRTATTTRTSGSTSRRCGGPCRLAVVRFAGEPRYFQLSAVRRALQDLCRRPSGLGDARRHPRPLRGGRGVQHRRRARRRGAGPACSSQVTRRTRAGRSRSSSPRRSCPSASRPTGRGGCSSPPTGRRSRRSAPSRTSRPPTVCRRRSAASRRSSGPPRPRRTPPRSPA